MELNWLETILFGFVSGLAEILPVSAQAHKTLLLRVFGAEEHPGLQYLLIHLSVFLALYYSNRVLIVKMSRARALSRIPKKKRKRPLDLKSMMDFRFLRTICIPVILAYIGYYFISGFSFSLLALAALIFANGLILYIPQFFPGSNKDSRSLTRLEGAYMGLGGALSILPGFSAVGTAVSVGSVCGVERQYSLTMALLMNMVIMIALMVYDVLSIITGGLGFLSVLVISHDLVTAGFAFLGTLVGVRIMRGLADENGYSYFAYYCWGVSLFTFILNLMA